MKKLVMFALVAIIALSMLLIGCGGGSTTTEQTTTPSATQTTTSTPPTTTSSVPPTTTETGFPQDTPHGTINVAIPDFSYEQFDPNYYTATWGYEIYDTLVTYNENGDYIGDVAQSWEISPDGNTWTFHIRHDIYFHDGTQLTSKDVKFSVDRFAAENSTNPWSPYLTRNYAGTSAPDDFTFIYNTEHPEPTLIVPFSVTWILPADYFTRLGSDAFNQNPIGSGPWKFVSHQQEVNVTFEANTDHWQNVPPFETLSINQVPEEATRIAMFKRGEMDVITAISTDRLVEMRDSGTKVLNVGLPTTWTVVWPGTWINNGPTHDKRVRQAMSYALNRQEICDTFYQGTAVPGGRWFIAPGGYGWDDSWTADPYDPDRAKELLAEAGYPDAFDTPVINFYVTATQENFAQVLLGYWTEIGLDVEINVMESVAWSGIVFVRNEDPTAPQAGGMWMWGPFPVVPNATGNDPHADELYAKATGELDPVLQKQYWTDFLNYAYDMWVNTGTVLIQPLTLVSDKIGDPTRGWISPDDAYATIQHAD